MTPSSECSLTYLQGRNDHPFLDSIYETILKKPGPMALLHTQAWNLSYLKYDFHNEVPRPDALPGRIRGCLITPEPPEYMKGSNSVTINICNLLEGAFNLPRCDPPFHSSASVFGFCP